MEAARASAEEKLRRLHQERAMHVLAGAMGAWMKRALSRAFRQWSMMALHGVESEKMRMLRQRERELRAEAEGLMQTLDAERASSRAAALAREVQALKERAIHLVHATVMRWIKMALARGYRRWVLVVLDGKAGEAVERRRQPLRPLRGRTPSP